MVSTNLIFISIIVLGIIYLYINSRQYLVREGYKHIGDKIGNCVKGVYSGGQGRYTGWCDPKCLIDAGNWNESAGKKLAGKKAFHCWSGLRYENDKAKYCPAAFKQCKKIRG